MSAFSGITAIPGRLRTGLAGVCFFWLVVGAGGFAAAGWAASSDYLSADSVSAPAAPDPRPIAQVGSGSTTPEVPAPAPDPDAIIAYSQSHQMLPYSFTAHILPQDATEVDLGLILSASPGIEVAVGWGAAEDWMLNARMTVRGSSSTVGLAAHYLLRPERAVETKPAITALAELRFVNQRTGEEVRENIFQGTRLQTGVAFTKTLGSLAASLQAGPGWLAFWNLFKINMQALLEYQNGREQAAELEVSRLEVGGRASLEAAIDPGKLFFFVAYDTQPDWVGWDNYYTGVRYFSNPDFAIDGLVGRIGNELGISAALAWIF